MKHLSDWFERHVNARLPPGWRKAALINTVLISTVSVLMVLISVIALIKAGGFNRPLIFFIGPCGMNGASGLNSMLHIVINILSTAMLASSNMFMQVLNAPTRREIDKSHARGAWLEIGVLSGRNTFRLSPFKMLAWLGFFASSVPIHLLFNSTIFEASFRFSHFDMAIVSEAFVQGGAYAAPGASLLNSGGLIFDPDAEIKASEAQDLQLGAGYGEYVALAHYADNTSAVSENIAYAALHGASWMVLDSIRCKREYLSCSGLSTYSDVLVVVNKTAGWPRSDVWSLTDEEDTFWDAYVPDDASETEHNSLWFYGNCTMSAYSGTGQTNCGNSCRWALGGSNATIDYTLPFYPHNTTAADVALSMGGNVTSNADEVDDDSTVFNYSQNDLQVSYCLARPVPEACKVALSTTLLVSVTACAILKAVLCLWVYRRLQKEKPLCTPGDAIDSFITDPDPYTADMCLLSQGEIRSSFFSAAPQPGPRQYQRRDRKLGAAVPSSEWFYLFVLMGLALATAIVLTLVIGIGSGGLRGGFGSSSSNPLMASGISLISAVLIANSPQLALSSTYVIYNNIFTRLVVGRSWALRSTQYSYLRVTEKKGPQRSKYRLQLPYRYSISLMVAGSFLHWLTSNAIYVFVSQGDYFDSLRQSQKDGVSADPNLPAGATVSVGYSVIALVMLAAGLLIAFTLPIIWSQKALPGVGNSVGCNSFAISASCHVSPLARPDFDTGPSSKLSARLGLDKLGAFEYNESQLTLLSRAGSASTLGKEDDRLERIAQSKLKWGVVEMPPKWSSQYSGSYEQVGHISFGTTDDEVERPQDGNWYA